MSNLKSAFLNLLTCKVSSKNKKYLNLLTKNTYLVFLGCSLTKTIIKCLISTLESVKLQSFIQNEKINKFGTKKSPFESLAGMLKSCCHIAHQRPPNCLIGKFPAKIRILKFGIKRALFGSFGQQFWKTIFTFEIRVLGFVLLQSLV